MTILLIILLILLVIYFWYQNRKLKTQGDNATSSSGGDASVIFSQENEDLIADKDAAIRAKNEAEAENLALSNHLRLKNQEVAKKDQEINRLKQEHSQSEISLNAKLKEYKNQAQEQSQITTTINQEKLKLQAKIEELEAKIKELTRPASPLPGEFPQENKDD